MSQIWVRALSFLSVFAVMAAWEVLAPWRKGVLTRKSRWPGNLGMAALNTALVRVLFPAAAVGAAQWTQAMGWGLLNNVPAPNWAAAAIAFLALDLAIYGQHIALHRSPLLWRLHRVHHADPDLDVTSGVRFHPLEILLSMVFKMAIVVALGAPPAAVLAFELALSLGALFNHANVRIWPALERTLRLLVVTPDVHRLHHSVRPEETNSNFGFSTTLWDRLFHTWRERPLGGQETMTIGLLHGRSARDQRLDQLLLEPLQPTS